MLIKASKPRSVFCTLAASAALLMVPHMPSFAAPQIGVTAALRGEVVPTASQVNDTDSNLTGFSTMRNVTSLRVNYAFSF